MQLIDYIDSLMPGDNDIGVPCFSAVAWPQLQKERDLLIRVDSVIEKFVNSSPGNADEGQEEWTSLFTSFFKREHNNLYLAFREVVVGLYFSSPVVLGAMGESEHPLFPRGQSLPAFNTDMLEGVFNRGKIWRGTN